MYTTVKEMHIALDMGLQHINSNRKQSISPYHKDIALNYAVLQFIENRTNPVTNVRKEGLEDTQKRYDDLRELKKSVLLDVLLDSNKPFVIFPGDYYKLISSGARTKYFNSNKPNPVKTKKLYYSIIPFTRNMKEFDNFRITQNSKVGNTTLYDFSKDVGMKGMALEEDIKFMIINNILSKSSNIHWEYWNDIHKPNSFIIINESSDVGYTIGYDSIVEKYYSNTVSYKSYASYPGDNIVPIDLISSQYEFEAQNNYYTSKNRHKNPMGFIEGSRLYLQTSDYFITSFVSVNYYKKPKTINHATGQMCELTINREIVDLALQRLKAYIKDDGYQHTLNENQIIE